MRLLTASISSANSRFSSSVSHSRTESSFFKSPTRAELQTQDTARYFRKQVNHINHIGIISENRNIKLCGRNVKSAHAIAGLSFI